MNGRRLSPGLFLLVSAVVLAPWIVWLVTSLPCSYQSRHWGIAWAGFDTGLAVVLGLTGIAALRRAPWLDRAAVVAAALLVADAWFDVVTSRGAHAVALAAAEALAVELPIAALCCGSHARPHPLHPRTPWRALRLSPPTASAPPFPPSGRGRSSTTQRGNG